MGDPEDHPSFISLMLYLEGSANRTRVQQQACLIEDIMVVGPQRLSVHSSLHRGMAGLCHQNHPASLLCLQPSKLICGLAGSAEFSALCSVKI